MNSKKILAGNKLIAVFLGAKIVKGKGVQSGNLYAEYRENGNYQATRNLNNMEYHSDWNELMEVWFKFQQKLNELSEEDGHYKSYLSQIQQDFCIGICEDESIETCYQALIEGIKWYNKQK